MKKNERAPRRTPSRGEQEGTGADPVGEDDVTVEESDPAAASGGTRDMPTTEPESLVGVAASMDSSQVAGMPTEEQYRGWFSSITKAVKGAVKKVTSTVSDHAKHVIKTGLPYAGTAVGGFFGGPAGAAIGGKAVSFAGGLVREMPTTAEAIQARAIRALDDYEVESSQMDAIVNDVLDQTLPVVIDEIAKDFAERGSRGEGGQADDEVMERFWGKAFGKIAGAIADELPWAIKKATQYLSDGGARDANAIDPLMIDPEVAQRFWGPAFSTIVMSIQSMLPAAFDQISGKSRAMQSSDDAILWQDLEETKRLRGGDNIKVTGQSPIDDPDMIEFALELPQHKSWWKGLQVRGADDSLIGSVDVEGEIKGGSVRVPADALREAGARLVFAKADGVYQLPAAELPQLAGKRVDFYWYAG